MRGKSYKLCSVPQEGSTSLGPFILFMDGSLQEVPFAYAVVCCRVDGREDLEGKPHGSDS